MREHAVLLGAPANPHADAWRFGYAKSEFFCQMNFLYDGLVACRSEFVSMAQPLPPVTAQYPTCLTEPRPEEAVVTIWLRQATRATSVGCRQSSEVTSGCPT